VASQGPVVELPHGPITLETRWTHGGGEWHWIKSESFSNLGRSLWIGPENDSGEAESVSHLVRSLWIERESDSGEAESVSGLDRSLWIEPESF
jgi:hypothetical protein